MDAIESVKSLIYVLMSATDKLARLFTILVAIRRRELRDAARAAHPATGVIVPEDVGRTQP